MPRLILTFANDVKDLDYEVIEFAGELDQESVSSVKEQILNFVAHSGAPVIIFDFAKLRFVNSEGIGFLVDIHKELEKKKRKLIIAGAQKHVDEVMHTMGIQEIIEYRKNISAAIAHIKKHS